MGPDAKFTFDTELSALVNPTRGNLPTAIRAGTMEFQIYFRHV